MRKLPPKDGTKALTQVEPRLNRHTAGLVPPRTVRAGAKGSNGAFWLCVTLVMNMGSTFIVQYILY